MITYDPTRPVIHSTFVTEKSHQFQGAEERDEPSFYYSIKDTETNKTYSTKRTTKQPLQVHPAQLQPQPQLYSVPVKEEKKHHIPKKKFQFEKVGINMGIDYSWRPFIPNIQPLPEPFSLDPPIRTEVYKSSTTHYHPEHNRNQPSQVSRDPPGPPEPPLPKKSIEYQRAAVAIWRVTQCIQFFSLKSEQAKKDLKHDYYKQYYDSDANAFLDQSIEMIKARIGLILDEVTGEEEIDLSTDSEKLEVNSGFLLDEIVDICSAKDPSKFDNALVLSYLASMSTAGAYLPHGAFTPWTVSRLPFSSTNQLYEPDESIGKLILGEYLIGRVLCRNILFNPAGHKSGEEISEQGRQNLKILGSCFVKAFENIVNQMELSPAERGESLYGVPLQPLGTVWTMDDEDNGFENQGDYDDSDAFVEVDPALEYQCFEEIIPVEDLEGADLETLQEKLSEALGKLFELAQKQHKIEVGEAIARKKAAKEDLANIGKKLIDKKYLS